MHHARDETSGVDRSQVRTGVAAYSLVAVRNVAVYLPEGVEADSKAAATRRSSVHRGEALALLFD